MEQKQHKKKGGREGCRRGWIGGESTRERVISEADMKMMMRVIRSNKSQRTD